MSAEDMEISVDFSHQAAEDIDIDLEFAAEQNDEDLELGDYNQAEEFQHFNSDNRDELMAEDDDASYAMADADADEINYNETTTAANDYDIVIGDTDVFTWQEHDTTDVLEPATNTDQNQETNDIESKHVDLISAVVDNVDEHPQAESAGPEPTIADSVEAVATVHILEENNSKDENTEAGTTADGVAAQVFETSNDNSNKSHISSITNMDAQTTQQQSPNSPTVQDASNPQSLDVADTRDATRAIQGTDNVHEDAEHNLDNGPGDEPDIEESATGPLDSSVPEESHDNDNGPEDEIGYDDLEGEGSIHEENVSSSAAANEASDDKSAQRHIDGTGDVGNDDGDFTAGNYQLGDDSFDHSEYQDDHEVAEAKEVKEASQEPSEHAGSAESANSVVDDAEDNADLGSATQGQDISAIAKRHTLVVHYGETDYQLVASEPDDDPSDYFFKDTSALDLSLGQFLSGIRNVISEEVSPLDELVLHIDGLGLEFAESMTNQILEEHTFGHILSLYDTLVQNDASKEAIEPPELYMYLMVRPNCLQRLMALQVQAASGRCLTDVAVYREASPAQEIDDQVDDNDVLAISPDYPEDELYDEDHHEDGNESQEHTESAEHDFYPAQSEDAEIELEASQYGDEEEDADQFATKDGEYTGDYDNLDLTPPLQDLSTKPTNESTTQELEDSANVDGATNEDGVIPTTRNEQNNNLPSESTSATVTLDGNPDDEIDYDENDQSTNGDVIQAVQAAPAPVASKLLPPADDEITWESENEEARNEQPVTSQPSEQVSTTPGKRTRSGSDAAASAGDRKDVKRQRS